MAQEDFWSVDLPDDWQQQLRKIVLAYLVHHCYQDTAICFSDSVSAKPTDSQTDHSGNPTSRMKHQEPSHMDVETQENLMESLSRRKQMMSLLLEGKIDQAIRLCEERYPSLIAPVNLLPGNFTDLQISLTFQLHCQHFIELIRDDRQAEALLYAQNILSPFGIHYPQTLPVLRASSIDYHSSITHTFILGCCSSHCLSKAERISRVQVSINRTSSTSRRSSQRINLV